MLPSSPICPWSALKTLAGLNSSSLLRCCGQPLSRIPASITGSLGAKLAETRLTAASDVQPPIKTATRSLLRVIAGPSLWLFPIRRISQPVWATARQHTLPDGFAKCLNIFGCGTPDYKGLQCFFRNLAPPIWSPRQPALSISCMLYYPGIGESAATCANPRGCALPRLPIIFFICIFMAVLSPFVHEVQLR